MRIQKRNTFGGKLRPEGMMYIKLNGRQLRISAALRDEILPYKRVYVDINGDEITLIPTNEENGFKLTITEEGCTTISASKYMAAVIGTKERIPCRKANDGTIKCTRSKKKG